MRQQAALKKLCPKDFVDKTRLQWKERSGKPKFKLKQDEERISDLTDVSKATISFFSKARCESYHI